ncbi:uncharacterized protein V1518DRAFT_378761 [Limtongia smithiae]|uniref:uncharacterized protein n=1 Tax=Limtongia smithiae TaxID=1125753 RepID=UPI0034CD6BE0
MTSPYTYQDATSSYHAAAATSSSAAASYHHRTADVALAIPPSPSVIASPSVYPADLLQPRAIPASAHLRGIAAAQGTYIEPVTRTHRRRASVSRSRTGCWPCRIRRKKCTNEHPVCAHCSRLGLTSDCVYGPCPEHLRTLEDKRRAASELGVRIRMVAKSRAASQRPASQQLHQPQLQLFQQQFMRSSFSSSSSSSSAVGAGLATTGDDDSIITQQLLHRLHENDGASQISTLEEEFYSLNCGSGRRAEYASLPFFLKLSFNSMDPIADCVGKFERFVDEIPEGIYNDRMSRPMQLLLFSTYVRYASRLLFPALYLYIDPGGFDFGLLLLNLATSDWWLWRSMCAIGAAYFTSIGQGAAFDESVIDDCMKHFHNVAAELISRPLVSSTIPNEELEIVLMLGWNVFTLCRLRQSKDTEALRMIWNLISHYSLLVEDVGDKACCTVRIVTAHAMAADILLATQTPEVLPMLAATYSAMLDDHSEGKRVFRVGLGTGVGISTPVLLFLASALDTEHRALWSEHEEGDSHTSRTLQAESTETMLARFTVELDTAHPTTQRCTLLMRVAVQVYLTVFCSTAKQEQQLRRVPGLGGGEVPAVVRDSLVVRGLVVRFARILAMEFMGLRKPRVLRPEEEESRQFLMDMRGQELERCLQWAIVVVASVTTPDAMLWDGAADCDVVSSDMIDDNMPCRNVYREVFEYNGRQRFGNWHGAWEVVQQTWAEANWRAGKSWRQVIREDDRLMPILF